MAITPKTTASSHKKPAAKQTTNTRTVTAKTADSKFTGKKPRPAAVSPASRVQMIEVAAYYIAEKHGFDQQHMDHWLAAEQEIDRQLNA